MPLLGQAQLLLGMALAHHVARGAQEPALGQLGVQLVLDDLKGLVRVADDRDGRQLGRGVNVVAREARFLAMTRPQMSQVLRSHFQASTYCRLGHGILARHFAWYCAFSFLVAPFFGDPLGIASGSPHRRPALELGCSEWHVAQSQLQILSSSFSMAGTPPCPAHQR